jgi:hypothetical protein
MIVHNIQSIYSNSSSMTRVSKSTLSTFLSKCYYYITPPVQPNFRCSIVRYRGEKPHVGDMGFSPPYSPYIVREPQLHRIRDMPNLPHSCSVLAIPLGGTLQPSHDWRCCSSRVLSPETKEGGGGDFVADINSRSLLKPLGSGARACGLQ